jgi:hypothetical protein
MGMHTLDELMRKWQREDVTAEQMVGQLLQMGCCMSGCG